ncbi:condensation domain-containing protein [Streptomyces sp. NPDC047718]|uniref:condensation domain-containing protein n=1 Tax=Streptomyces sp. NPDC047718 TaxID=3155479 RepID=UPI00340E5A8C
MWHQGYHHLVMDAYGYALVRQRVAQTYTSLAEGRKVPQCAFGSLDDLVAADAEYRTSTQFVTDRAYWMERFADRPAPTRIAGRSPVGSARPVRRTGESEVRHTAVLHPPRRRHQLVVQRAAEPRRAPAPGVRDPGARPRPARTPADVIRGAGG